MQSTIDLAAFGELQSTAGADFARELVDTFLVEAPLMLDDLRDAYAAGDADTFRRTAHSLKSNSNTFGALTLGYLRDVVAKSFGRFSVGGDVTGYLVPANLEESYGSPVSFHLYIRYYGRAGARLDHIH